MRRLAWLLFIGGASLLAQRPGGSAGAFGGPDGTVTSITLAGTANQITVTGTCAVTTTGTCTFSIPSDFRLPGTINKITLTQPATGSTLTIADGKTATFNNGAIFTGTDGSTLTFGTGGTLTYTSNNLSVFAATTSAQLAGVISDEVGSGFAVFAATNTTTVNGTACTLGSSCTVAAGAPAVFYWNGIDSSTAAGWGLSWPSTGGGGPTLIPVEGASSGDVTTVAAATTVSYLSFTDNASNATANSVQVKMPVPSTFGTTALMDVRFRAVATSGNAFFQVSGQCVHPPAVPGSFSSAVSFTAKAVGGTTLQWVDTAQLTLSTADALSGCAAGDTLWLRFWRQGNSGSDTLSTGTCTLPATGNGCAEVAQLKVTFP